MRFGAVSTAVVAGGEAGALGVQQSADLDRLLRLIEVTGLAHAVSATIIAVSTAMEQSRTAGQTKVEMPCPRAK